MTFEDYIANAHLQAAAACSHSTLRAAAAGESGADMAATAIRQASERQDDAVRIRRAQRPPASSSSTGIDMAHFMLAYLNGGTYNGYQMLKPATISEMWTPQIEPGPERICTVSISASTKIDSTVSRCRSHAATRRFHSDLHLMPTKIHRLLHLVQHTGQGRRGRRPSATTLPHVSSIAIIHTTPKVEADASRRQKDAARVSGWYESQPPRRTRARLRLRARAKQCDRAPDGTIEVSMLKDAAGNPFKWHEVGPLHYQQVNGQAHLMFNTDANGNVISWTTRRFHPGRDRTCASPACERWVGQDAAARICRGVHRLSLLIRLGAWIARRKLRLQLNLRAAR